MPRQKRVRSFYSMDGNHCLYNIKSKIKVFGEANDKGHIVRPVVSLFVPHQSGHPFPRYSYFKICIFFRYEGWPNVQTVCPFHMFTVDKVTYWTNCETFCCSHPIRWNQIKGNTKLITALCLGPRFRRMKGLLIRRYRSLQTVDLPGGTELFCRTTQLSLRILTYWGQ